MAWEPWRRWGRSISSQPALTSKHLPGHGLIHGAALGEPGEQGEGGPSLFVHELADLRLKAQQEAETLGQAKLEPEQWENGRMSFEFERYLAHEHEGLRDRLADHVSAETRDTVQDLCGEAEDVVAATDSLRQADQELAEVLHSWNAAYREVHEDELELGRYFRLKSVKHRTFKALIAFALFGAELAVSTALFGRIVSQDNAAFPLLFALGLILILIVVPHYAAIGLTDGLFNYHEAEMRAYDEAEQLPPVSVRKKARREEVDDRGMKIVAGFVGLALVGLIIPVSSLRATELGGGDNGWFWFAFFLFLQTAISGYFFLREWLDHGAASANLMHHDASKKEAEKRRARAFDGYVSALADYQEEAQQLLFLYRQTPRWDSHIVQTYHATVHYFRHQLTVQRPDLDVFISHATIPLLSAPALEQGPNCGLSSIASERPDVTEQGVFSRQWWMRQVTAALEDTMASPSSVEDDSLSKEAGSRPSPKAEMVSAFDSPTQLLKHMLSYYGDLQFPYQRPKVLDEIQEIRDHESPPVANGQASPGSIMRSVNRRHDHPVGLSSPPPTANGRSHGAADLGSRGTTFS